MRLAGGAEIVGTPGHRTWSIDRQEFIGLSEFRPGERVDTVNGPGQVIDVETRFETQQVFNLEVAGQHVYRVGQNGVLVHNTGGCDDIAKEVAENAPRSGKWNRPNVQDSTLRDVVDNLWRPQDKRPGGTIAELLREKASGGPLIHLEKAKGRLTQLIRRVNDFDNPLSKADRAAAE